MLPSLVNVFLFSLDLEKKILKTDYVCFRTNFLLFSLSQNLLIIQLASGKGIWNIIQAPHDGVSELFVEINFTEKVERNVKKRRQGLHSFAVVGGNIT